MKRFNSISLTSYSLSYVVAVGILVLVFGYACLTLLKTQLLPIAGAITNSSTTSLSRSAVSLTIQGKNMPVGGVFRYDAQSNTVNKIPGLSDSEVFSTHASSHSGNIFLTKAYAPGSGIETITGISTVTGARTDYGVPVSKYTCPDYNDSVYPIVNDDGTVYYADLTRDCTDPNRQLIGGDVMKVTTDGIISSAYGHVDDIYRPVDMRGDVLLYSANAFGRTYKTANTMPGQGIDIDVNATMATLSSDGSKVYYISNGGLYRIPSTRADANTQVVPTFLMQVGYGAALQDATSTKVLYTAPSGTSGAKRNLYAYVEGYGSMLITPMGDEDYPVNTPGFTTQKVGHAAKLLNDNAVILTYADIASNKFMLKTSPLTPKSRYVVTVYSLNLNDYSYAQMLAPTIYR